jgi:hypothetical protein
MRKRAQTATNYQAILEQKPNTHPAFQAISTVESLPNLCKLPRIYGCLLPSKPWDSAVGG